jgi:predicted dienelactone hydrolase
MVRTFEVLILATLFLRLIGCSLPTVKRSRWIDLLPSLAVLLTVIHLVVEKYRWQMVPAYGVTLLLFLLSLLRIKRGGQPADKQPSRRVLVVIGFLFRLLIFAFVAALPILLPVFRLSEPTGPQPVGTTKLHLVDRTRPETFTPTPDDHRELMVQVWYPARVEPGARPAPLMEHMPFPFSYLSLVRTHAYLDAPVSDAHASYPVLIFSHGHVGFVEQNLTQMEELASYGYVVCSIAHTYHAIATVFPDGRVIPADSALANDFLKGNSPTQDVYAEHLRIWTDDTLFLINELESIQAGERESMFAGKLDMARLGIFGQSFGGVTAVQVCAIDGRCQAGITLDAGLPRDHTGRTIDSPLKQPFMFMLNEGMAHYMHTALDAVENTAYGVTVRGTTHFDFTDLFLYSPVLKFTKAFGPIDGYRMVKIVNDYALAFFDKHLRGEMSPLLDGPSADYPDVEFQSHVP